eukprot:GEZU01025787.1.p1 GENE.GEZU01025787.1~~GEZU01025787.1.p1  ORF type:complete len:537 (+),score=223.01 GEZU01025787.1:50-1660(+)
MSTTEVIPENTNVELQAESSNNNASAAKVKAFPEIDGLLNKLNTSKRVWANMKISEKLALLEKCLHNIPVHMDEWANLVCEKRRIAPEFRDAEIGAEYTQIFVVARALRLLLSVLADAAKAEQEGRPIKLAAPPSITRRADGQVVAKIFPWGLKESVMWSGITSETWIKPGCEPTQGTALQNIKFGSEEGAISLVLGAGNVNSIVFLDSLEKLIKENKVVIVKQNPVNDYIKVVFDKIMAPLIEKDFVFIITGGAEEGKYLTQHPLIEDVHITGALATHDAIVWGSTPDEQERRKKDNDPVLKKSITSELGCVTPFIIVPGRWSESELDWKARDICGAVFNNCSFNCVACKLLVMSKNWPQRQQLINKIKEYFAKEPARYAYYPGACNRYKAFMDKYPQAVAFCDEKTIKDENHLKWAFIEGVDEYAFNNEPFAPLLSEISLDESDPAAFIEAAVKFCNEKVWGNLSCSIIVHPSTYSQHTDAIEKAIADLKYGNVGLNVWTGMAYALVSPVWGGYVDNTLDNAVSGLGYGKRNWH